MRLPNSPFTSCGYFTVLTLTAHLLLHLLLQPIQPALSLTLDHICLSISMETDIRASPTL